MIICYALFFLWGRLNKYNELSDSRSSKGTGASSHRHTKERKKIAKQEPISKSNISDQNNNNNNVS